MALGTPTDGGAAYSASGGTTVSPAYPASIASGDCLVLIVGQKPSTRNSGTVTTPSGWTLREELTAAGDYGNTLGADTGNTNLRIYTKDTVAGTETGNLSVTIGTNNVSWGIIVRIPSGAGNFTYGTADGSRTTAPTSGVAFTTLLTNGTTAPNIESGDVALWAMCIPTDVLANGFGTPTISSTGTTFGTAVELEEPDSGTGNDIGGYVAYASARSGSSTAAPTVGVTATGTVTNVRGPIALIRIREVLAPLSGSMSVTETGTDTFSGAGDVIVKGSLAATETGEDTFNASGTVTDPGITGSLAATETGSDTFSASGTVAFPTITGSLSATEVGADTFSGSGNVLISGSLSATEVGNDTFGAAGNVLISGLLSAQEVGNDTFEGSGTVNFASIIGDMAATETGSDTASASGTVLISGSLAATESGQDAFSSNGNVFVSGSLSAQEQGSDTFSGSGNTGNVVSGSMSATESGADVFGTYVFDGYVLDGYVEPGVFGTVTGDGNRGGRTRKKKGIKFLPFRAPINPIELAQDGKATIYPVYAVASLTSLNAYLVREDAEVIVDTVSIRSAVDNLIAHSIAIAVVKSVNCDSDVRLRAKGVVNPTDEELIYLFTT
jgi:hypothetical protein